MNVARVFGVAAVLVLASSLPTARAQSATRSHFGRTTSGMDDRVPPGRSLPQARTSPPTRPEADPLAPYTSRPRGASSGTPIAPPAERPAPRPLARNYYPAARSGQVGHRCTPSRASVLGGRR